MILQNKETLQINEEVTKFVYTAFSALNSLSHPGKDALYPPGLGKRTSQGDPLPAPRGTKEGQSVLALLFLK